MARQHRLLPAGYPVHVVQRGVNRAACFHKDPDYLCYLQLLTEHSRKFACAVHAYALMPNYVHLLVTPDDDRAISLLMKSLAQRYTQYLNRSRGRTGPLWEGRFKSSVVADDAYLLACCRYIELDPVRAGLVDHPLDYAWSRHRANADLTPSVLVTRHPVYIALAGNDDACVYAHRGLFRDVLQNADTERIRDAVNRGVPMRGPRFGIEWGRANRGRTPTVKTGVWPLIGETGHTPNQPGSDS